MYNKAEYAKWKQFERDIKNIDNEMLCGYHFNTNPDREYSSIEKRNELFNDEKTNENGILSKNS